MKNPYSHRLKRAAHEHKEATEHLKACVLYAHTHGMSLREIAAHVGVAHTTVRKWIIDSKETE